MGRLILLRLRHEAVNKVHLVQRVVIFMITSEIVLQVSCGLLDLIRGQLIHQPRFYFKHNEITAWVKKKEK